MINTADYILKNRVHLGWDNSLEPALKVAPGDIVEFEAQDASGGQLNSESTVKEVPNLDFEKVNPVTGPVYVDGAVPGDALKISILSFDTSGWGWTAIIPGFGLLADQFDKPALHIWKYDNTPGSLAEFKPGGKVPVQPFPGTIGNAPAVKGLHSVVNPRNVGGNMDTRGLCEGSVLYLPVEVAGGLLSVGDAHAAQGDGEICGTAIESPMNISFKIEVEKEMNLKFPRFTTAGPVCRHIDENGYEVTMGIGPDLMQNARDAVSQMVDLISKKYKMDPDDVYMLCSVCADLRIPEIVDMPDWIVSFNFPKSVFA
ncbi:MAG: acetamidase/formamidase family protein [Desulfobacula sp.]|nr:acetamidase/formamidase family protein [Desulfobacula sp.]